MTKQCRTTQSLHGSQYDSLNLHYTLEKDGKVIKKKSSVCPMESQTNATTLCSNGAYLTDPHVEYFVNFEVKLKHDCVWAPAGHVVATEQFALNEKINKPSEIKTDTTETKFKSLRRRTPLRTPENNNCEFHSIWLPDK